MVIMAMANKHHKFSIEICIVKHSVSPPGDKAIFSSPWLITSDWYDYNCNLTFWYHMKGDHIGQLDVTETSTGYWSDGDKLIWTRDSSVVSSTPRTQIVGSQWPCDNTI